MRPDFWDHVPEFPGILNFAYSPYMGQYKTKNGKIIMTLCPVFGAYSEKIAQTGKFVGYHVSYKGYSGFVPFAEAKNTLTQMVMVALTRELE